MVNLLALLAAVGALTLAASGVVVAKGQGSGDTMTICHIPPGNPEHARTMRISPSAWSAHEGHGDHKGSCTQADSRPPPPGEPPKPAPATTLSIRLGGDGDLDGDASFRLVLANQGEATGFDLDVRGTLTGDGRWTVHSDPGVACVVDGPRLTCTADELAAGAHPVVRLSFDGDLSVCREASVEAGLTANNDSSTGDDQVRHSVWVGACSPLDHHSASE